MKQLLAAAVLVVMAACGQGVDEGLSTDFESRSDALTAVDLKLGLSGINSFPVGNFTLTYVVTNLGQTFSAPVSVDITVPAGAALVSSSANRCSTISPSLVRCALPGMGLNRSYTSTATFSMVAGNATFAAQASSTSAESNLANNLASLFTIAVAPGPIVAPIAGNGGAASYVLCSGTGLTSFNQCVPGSLMTRTVYFDATTWRLSANPMGTWSQGQAQTDLAMHYNGTTLNAVAVSSTCFQGLWTNDTTGAVSGAARVCF